MDKLCVIGHPSKVGGADTELDHQIRCWQKMGVEVYICHTGKLDDNLKAMDMANRGCKYLPPRDWKRLKDFHVISFCNGEFLKALPEIKKHARTTSFVNCMCWPFDAEIEATEKGLIDFSLYQTPHAREKAGSKLEKFPKYHPVMFKPYFHIGDFVYRNDRPRDRFRFGRISRGDADKFGKSQLWIYDTMTAPVPKVGVILGWDDRARKKFEREPPSFVSTFAEGAITQKQFYDICDAVIMTTDTFENLPRVGFEAMASGCVLIVDNKGGWKTLVEDRVTGWLCDSEREFVYKASRCAFEHSEREEMAGCALEAVHDDWGLEASMKSWDQVFTKWEIGAKHEIRPLSLV